MAQNEYTAFLDKAGKELLTIEAARIMHFWGSTAEIVHQYQNGAGNVATVIRIPDYPEYKGHTTIYNTAEYAMSSEWQLVDSHYWQMYSGIPNPTFDNPKYWGNYAGGALSQLNLDQTFVGKVND